MDYSLRCMKEIPRVPYAANVINAVTSAEKQLKDARIPLLSSVIEGGESVANWILSFKLIAMFVAFADWSLTKTLQVALFCAEKTASLLAEPKTAVQHANNSAAEVTEETEEQMTSEPEKPAVEHRAPRRYSYEAKELKPIISDEEVSPKNESSESPTPAVAEINGEDEEWKTAERGYDEVDEEESVDEPADEPEPTVQVEECDDDEGGEDVDYGEFAEEMDDETNKSAEEGDLTGGHD